MLCQNASVIIRKKCKHSTNIRSFYLLNTGIQQPRTSGLLSWLSIPSGSVTYTEPPSQTAPVIYHGPAWYLLPHMLLYMEFFKEKEMVPGTPRLWKSYVDDTLCIHKKGYTKVLLMPWQQGKANHQVHHGVARRQDALLRKREEAQCSHISIVQITLKKRTHVFVPQYQALPE